MSPDQIFELVNQYKYLILLPFMVFEGPIATVIGGFLASVGVLNFLLVFMFSVFGDFIGDSIWWSIGKSSRVKLISKLLNRIGIKKERFLRIESHFKNNGMKTLMIGKFIYGFETVSLVAAGAAHMPYWRFTLYTLTPTILKSLLFTIVGFYFGHAYNQVSNYLDNVALAVVVFLCLAIIFFVLYKFVYIRWSKRVSRQL